MFCWGGEIWVRSKVSVYELMKRRVGTASLPAEAQEAKASCLCFLHHHGVFLVEALENFLCSKCSVME